METMGQKVKDMSRRKPTRIRLPKTRAGVTHKFEIAGVDGYITTGEYPDGSLGEVFITIAKEGSTLSGVMDSLATVTSISIQYGVPLKTLVDKMVNRRFPPDGITSNAEIRFATSIVDYIFKWLGMKYLSEKDKEELGLHISEQGR